MHHTEIRGIGFHGLFGALLTRSRLQDISLSVHSAMKTAELNFYEVLVPPMPRKALAEAEMQIFGCRSVPFND